MMNMNRVTLLGHAGRDPEIRTLPDGEKTAAFGLATTERWKGQDGELREATEWHRIVVYGASVEAVETMVRKGGALLVEGRLAGREYRDREGVTKRIVEIVVAGRHGLVNVLSGRPDANTGADTDTGTDTDAAPDAAGPPDTADPAACPGHDPGPDGGTA